MSNKIDFHQGDMADSFLKGTLILTASGMFVKLIGALNWILLSRVLGGEGIGLYQMAFPIYLLALSISTAGIPVAISIVTAEKIAFKDYAGAHKVFKIVFIVLSITGFIFSLVMYFGAGWLVEYQIIRDSRAYWSLVALAPAVFIVSMLASFRGYLQGYRMMTPTAVSQIVEQLVRVMTMLLFASMLLPYGMNFAAAGASFGTFPGALAGLFIVVYYYFRVKRVNLSQISNKIGRPYFESNFFILKRIVKLAIPVSAASIMLPIVSNLDLLIVPGRLEVAGYSVEEATELFGYLTGMAVPLINMATILTASLAISLVPTVSEALSLGKTKNILQQVTSAMRLANIITIPASIGLYILAAPIANLVYNAPNAGGPIEILALGIFLLGVHQVTTGVLQGMGHTAIPMINMGLSASIKVYLNWMLIPLPTLGILGAAWATVADIGIAALLNLAFLKYYIGLSFSSLNITKPLIAVSIMGITIYGVYNLTLSVFSSNAMATIVVFLVAVLVYSLCMLMIGGITHSDLLRIPIIGKRLVCVLKKIKFLNR